MATHVKRHKKKYIAAVVSAISMAVTATVLVALQLFGVLGPVLCMFSADEAKCIAAAKAATEAATKLEDDQ